MITKERPNFRFVENKSIEVDYESFKEDFLNPYMTVDEIKSKYGMSTSDWKEYRVRVLNETGLSRKPCYTYGRLHYIFNNKGNAEYIQKKSNGYIITKKWGDLCKYYGRYEDYETAKMVRDKIVDADWDMDVASVLMDKYGVHSRRMPSLKNAKLVYDDFEELYFHSNLKIHEILDKLHISTRVYAVLVKMIRENHDGLKSRPRSRKC